MALHLYDIIKRPVITEKSNIMAGELNQFVFEVDLKANKIQIKEAVESIFDVDVIKVATLIMPLKRGKRGRKAYVRSTEWKKAIVTLPKGQTISLFNV
ncbi:MAG: 50S ribosomal protein L23 [Chloroflexota bacterium]